MEWSYLYDLRAYGHRQLTCNAHKPITSVHSRTCVSKLFESNDGNTKRSEGPVVFGIPYMAIGYSIIIDGEIIRGIVSGLPTTVLHVSEDFGAAAE